MPSTHRECYFPAQNKNFAIKATHMRTVQDYDGGTLMECFIHPKINYNEIPTMIKKQRKHLYERIRAQTDSQVK